MARLAEIDERLAEEAEVEELILYPHVVERLKKCSLRYRVAHTPDKIPQTRYNEMTSML